MNTIDTKTVENVEINEAHGIYLHIDNQTHQYISDLKTCSAKEKYEITVNVQGYVKHFTLAEFIARLGFKPEDLIKKEEGK